MRSNPGPTDPSPEAPEVRVQLASRQQANLVREIMLAAFAEYREVLDPPSSSYQESLQDVERAMSEGGAVLAWLGQVPVGTARFKIAANHLYVGRVAVLPEYRGRRSASRMMQWIEGFAPTLDRYVIRVDVRMVLTGNLSFFQGLGYKLIDTYQHPRGNAMCGTLVKSLSE